MEPITITDMIKDDAAFAAVDIQAALDPARFVGRAPEQVDEFLKVIDAQIRAKYAPVLPADGEVRL